MSFHNFSPRVTLEQKMGPGKLIYATFAKGFKAGGYNLGQSQPGYYPENLTDYEVGIKLDLLDRKLRVNGAGFYYDYKDLQVTVSGPFSAIIQNAATAKIYGAELELTAVPAHGLELDASAALLKTKFTQFDSYDPSRPQLGALDLSGNRLPNAPSYTLSYGVQYTVDTTVGPITVRGDGRSISRVYFDQFNGAPNSERAFTVVNASIGWKDAKDQLSATAFVRNLANGRHKNGDFVYGGIVGYPLAGDYDPPRIYGVQLGVRF